MTTHRWLIFAVIFVVAEILPPVTHFFCLCLAFGALGGAIASAFGRSAWIQWAVFGATSVALVPLLVPLAKFLFATRKQATNVDALINEKALVLEPIDPKSPGVVRVHGESWRAMSENDAFAKDAWVQIVRVEGTHVIVRGNN